MIQGIAATLAAVALVAVVGVQVIGPMISAVASKLASVVAQAAPATVQAARQLATSLGNSLTQALTQLRSFITNGADPVSLARYAANLEIAQAVTEFGSVAVQGGLQVRSGVHQAQAAEHLADVRVRMAVSEEITSYLRHGSCSTASCSKAFSCKAPGLKHRLAASPLNGFAIGGNCLTSRG